MSIVSFYPLLLKINFFFSKEKLAEYFLSQSVFTNKTVLSITMTIRSIKTLTSAITKDVSHLYKKLGYVFYIFYIYFVYVFKKSTVFIRNLCFLYVFKNFIKNIELKMYNLYRILINSNKFSINS